MNVLRVLRLLRWLHGQAHVLFSASHSITFIKKYCLFACTCNSCNKCNSCNINRTSQCSTVLQYHSVHNNREV